MATPKKSKGQEAKDSFELVPAKLYADLDTELDPHLQKQLLPSTHPYRRKALSAGVLEAGWTSEELDKTDPGYLDRPLDVIALLKAPGQVPRYLDVSRTIGKVGDLVTGSVVRRHIVAVRREVVSLKAVLPLHLDLLVSVPAVRCGRADLAEAFPGRQSPLDGTKVIVGIVDRGCDFAHPNFRRPSGETRLLYLWDQRGGKQPDSPGFGYGLEFDSTRINHALEQSDPYGDLGYQLEAATHGTHVLDIAAGNGNGTDIRGVAPNADLIFVDLAIDEEEKHGTIGDSRHLLEAVDYIFAKARALKRPAVINLSLGMHSGPHDGTTLVEEGFERLLNEEKGRAIVVAAGNAGGQPIHVGDTIAAGSESVIHWQIAATAGPGQECEIWYNGSSSSGATREERVEVSLESPSGQLKPVLPGETFILVKDNVPVGYVIHRANDPNNHDNHIDLQLPPSEGKDAKPWKIKLKNQRSQPIRYDAWIRRDDFGQSQLRDSIQGLMLGSQTLGAICCGESTLTVGAFDAHLPGLTPFRASGEGPVRKNLRKKPDLLAPGVGVVAASARSSSSLLQLSGTSMAVPHVTGLVALLFQAAGPLSVKEVQAAITAAATLAGASNTSITTLINQTGHGRIDGVDTLKRVLPSEVRVAAPPTSPQPGASQPEVAAATADLASAAAKGNGSSNGNGSYLTTAALIAALHQVISTLDSVESPH